MQVIVHLHTVLQYRNGQERMSELSLMLPEDAAVADVLNQLEIEMEPDALILVVNHRVADRSTRLSDGDRLDIVPAISGG